MKKARIMLAAIAVLGLIGGTLAFKAQRYFVGGYYYATTLASTGDCFKGGYTTTNSGNPAAVTVFLHLTTTPVGPYYGVVGQTSFYCTSTTAGFVLNAE